MHCVLQSMYWCYSEDGMNISVVQNELVFIKNEQKRGNEYRCCLKYVGI